MVHGNAVFIREEVKLARNTHRYAFSMQNFNSFNSVNFPEHKSNYTNGCKKLFGHVIMTWCCGALPIKAGTYCGAESFAFSQQFARN